MKIRSHSFRTVLISLAIATAAGGLTAAGLLEKFENLTYDAAFRLGGNSIRNPDLVLAVIDEASLQQLGRWPWSRSRFAELLAAISAGGPAVIGVDIGFFEPDPERPEGDRELVAAVKAAGNVIFPVYLAPRPSLGEITAFQEPFPELARAAGSGHVHTEPSLDGVTRKIYLNLDCAGGVRTAFALAVVGEFFRNTGRDGSLQLSRRQLRIGEITIPSTTGPEDRRRVTEGLIGQEYPLYIRFAGPSGTFLRLPAWEILRPGFPREFFRGKIVLVGATAAGLGDFGMTPLSTERNPMPGVEIQANIVNTILSGRFITHFPFSPWLGLLLLLSIFAGWIFDRRAGRGALLWLTLLPAATAGLYLILLLHCQIRLDLWPLLAVVPVNYLAIAGRKLAFLFRSLDREIAELSRRREDSPFLPAPASEEKKTNNIFLAASLEKKVRILHRLSQVINQERSLLSSMLENIRDGVIVADRQGAVILVNRMAEEMLKEIGEDPGNLILADFLVRRCGFSRQETVPAGGDNDQGEGAGRETTLADRQYLLSLSAIGHNREESGGRMAVFNDITDLKKLAQLRAETMAILSHEIMKPLSGIIGFCDMYLQGMVKPGEIPDYISLIKDSAGGLVRLLKNYLTVARLEAGREGFSPRSLDLSRPLRESIALLSPLAMKKKILIEEDLPDLLPEIRGDQEMLRQVFFNLLENAILYSPPGLPITVTFQREGEKAVLRFADRGPGVPETERERIFEKFFRGRQTQETAGTGLGLAVCREIIERHGGEITIAERTGGGAVFAVFLPLSEPEPGPGGETALPPPPGKIFLAE